MERRLQEEKKMNRRQKKYVHEGKYVAEVEIELVESDTSWSPLMSVEDAYKLDDIREALHVGDIKRAGKLARVYVLAPVSV